MMMEVGHFPCPPMRQIRQFLPGCETTHSRTRPAHGVCPISAELIEKHQLPYRSAIFGRISRAGLHPEAIGMLSGENGGNGVGSHSGSAGLAHVGGVFWLV